jgi:hypothetical protein
LNACKTEIHLFLLNSPLKESAVLRETNLQRLDVRKVISEAVDIAVFSQCEPVVDGLLDLAFALVKVSAKEDQVVAYGAAGLATEILLRLIRRNSDAIRTVLDTIGNQIGTCRNPGLLGGLLKPLMNLIHLSFFFMSFFSVTILDMGCQYLK